MLIIVFPFLFDVVTSEDNKPVNILKCPANHQTFSTWLSPTHCIIKSVIPTDLKYEISSEKSMEKIM
jgi:hypothetical protein